MCQYHSLILEASLSKVCHHNALSSQAQAAIKQIIKMCSETLLDISETQFLIRGKTNYVTHLSLQLQSIMAAKAQEYGSGSQSLLIYSQEAQSKASRHGFSSFPLFHTVQGPSHELPQSCVKGVSDDNIIKLSFAGD